MKGSFDSEYLYLKIYKQLIEDIESGAYPPKSKIPSESELCSTYSVSRDTVRHALNMLVRNGKIIKRPGLGSYVRSESEWESTSYGIDPIHLNNPVIPYLLFYVSKEDRLNRNIRD